MAADAKMFSLYLPNGTDLLLGSRYIAELKKIAYADNPYIAKRIIEISGEPWSEYKRHAPARHITTKYTQDASGITTDKVRAAVFSLQFDTAEDTMLVIDKTESLDATLFTKTNAIRGEVAASIYKGLVNTLTLKWWVKVRAQLATDNATAQVAISDDDLSPSDPAEAVKVLKKIEKKIAEYVMKTTDFDETIPNNRIFFFVSPLFRAELNNLYSIVGREPNYVQGTSDFMINGIQTTTDMNFINQNIKIKVFDKAQTLDLSKIRGMLFIKEYCIGAAHSAELYEQREQKTNNLMRGGKMIGSAKVWDEFKTYCTAFVSETFTS